MYDKYNICKAAHDDMHEILEAWSNGEGADMEKAIWYLANRAICMDSQREDFWKQYHGEVYGAMYPKDDNRGRMTDDHEYDHEEYEEGGHDHEKYSGKRLSKAEMTKWLSEMVNQDGTHGAHWNVNQTTSVGEKNGMNWEWASKETFHLVMNAKYSDYYNTAKAYGREKDADFFAKMSMDDICDEDKVDICERLYVTYHFLVKH